MDYLTCFENFIKMCNRKVLYYSLKSLILFQKSKDITDVKYFPKDASNNNVNRNLKKNPVLFEKFTDSLSSIQFNS